MPDFPVLDAPRSDTPGRTIHDVFGDVEPYIDETDSWFSMPVRLVHCQFAGWSIEIGPYTLNRADIECLRAAIGAYDAATGRS